MCSGIYLTRCDYLYSQTFTSKQVTLGHLCSHRELVSSVNVVCGVIHLTLKDRAAFGQMNHKLLSMNYIDQVILDYSKSLSKR